MSAYWETLSHNGVNFPEEYVPSGLTIKVNGAEAQLTPLAEEMAYHLAKKKDTPYIQDPVFTSNFMKDFSKLLPPAYRRATYSEVDFSRFFNQVDQERADKESMSKEKKKSLAAKRKNSREALKARYGRATVDGKEVEIANWMVEPPGLFMGRGQHPLRGSWKPRVTQDDVILNLDEKTTAPAGKWKQVVHDHNSMWMAKWVDKLTEKEKYVWLHETSPIQQSRNMAKYDKAQAVGKNLDRIRSKIEEGLESNDEVAAQVATVCYLIDRLGMRVGDEKDEDEADTVGASTLRVEHVQIDGPTVEFKFLGKDSVPWLKKDTPPPAVVRNLKRLTSGKSQDAEVFHHVSSQMVNQFLSSIVPGLSAKVFRTYHATATADEVLHSKNFSHAEDLDKLYHAKEANLAAAVFCNHQRTPPKTWEQSLEKKKERLELARASGSEARAQKLEREVDFYVRTKNYNLNTSMKNYIDPRVYKKWCDEVGLEWAKVYSKSLQKKFSWVSPEDAVSEPGVGVSPPASGAKHSP
ncbi:MAG: DNA topoisomerase I [archaeon]|nr:MAG: DNA topoisomerase I [archaeon]